MGKFLSHQRSEFTTKGFDPTVVVTHMLRVGALKLEMDEFQSCVTTELYWGSRKLLRLYDNKLGEKLHTWLERRYYRDMDQHEEYDDSIKGWR